MTEDLIEQKTTEKRTLKNETVRLAFELGLTDFYIKQKVNEVLVLAAEKRIDFSDPDLSVLVGYDAQGPQVRIIDANFSPLINVAKGISSIYTSKNIYRSIISGWDLSTLRHFRDRRLGITEMGIIGEKGSVFEDGGKIFKVYPIPEEKHLKMKQKIFIAAAKAGIKIAIQGNLSDRVACIYFEADEIGRGDLRNHFLVKGTDIRTQDLYEILFDKSGFEFDGREIIFEPTLENIRQIDWVLGKAKPLNSVSLFWKDGKINLRRSGPRDNANLSIRDIENFVRSVVPEDWQIDLNPDFCADISYTGDGIENSKENAANILAKRKFKSDKFVITNVGDKKADILKGKNTISFPMFGTEAYKFCTENRIPHVPVISAVDYSLILAEILNKEFTVPRITEAMIENICPASQ